MENEDLIKIKKNDLLFKLIDTMTFTIEEEFKDIDRKDMETFSDIYSLIKNSIKTEINFNFPELKDKNPVSAEAIFSNPLHAYTKGLMSSVPRLDETEKVRLNTIEGQPPLLLREIDGCAFAARNPNRDHCLTDRHPVLVEKEKDHWVADCPGCLM